MNTKPQRSQLNRAIRQLAASLPQTQYSYKGVMGGDEVKDVMKLKRARSGEQIKREDQYEVNLHNFCNHKRAIKKIIQRSTGQINMQRDITDYISKVKQEFESQEMLAPKPKVSLLKRFMKLVKNISFEILLKLIYRN